EHRQPAPHSGARQVSLQFQIDPGINAVRWRVQRTAAEFEHAVIHSQPHWTDQTYLHAAARVDGEARVGVLAKGLAVHASARDDVRLKARDGHWRLQEYVAGAGLERRRQRRRVRVVRRIRVLEFEAHDQQPYAQCETA